MKRSSIMLAGLGALAVAASLPAIGMAQGKSGGEVLAALSPGLWSVRFRDGAPERKICVRSGQELVQLRHAASSCKRYVTENGRSAVTVQYSCQGTGHGRTSFRVESSELVQIESQGIDRGRPFRFSAEARRAGSCR